MSWGLEERTCKRWEVQANLPSEKMMTPNRECKKARKYFLVERCLLERSEYFDILGNAGCTIHFWMLRPCPTGPLASRMCARRAPCSNSAHRLYP